MGDDIDLDSFLRRPLVARVATSGPAVTPVWFLWEDRAFWVLTGPWSKLPRALKADPAVALVVDSCDLSSGETLQVLGRGRADLIPFDVERGGRLLARYLGPDPEAWDPRFRSYVSATAGRGALWARIRPNRLVAKDLSFRPSHRRGAALPAPPNGRPKVSVRAARADDIDALVRLLGTLFAQENEFVADPVLQGNGVAALLSRPETARVIVAERDGEVVGMVSLQVLISTALGAAAGFIEDMVVEPAARDSGIGTRLLAAAVEEAERLDCGRVTLLTDAENASARRFYERRGFTPSPMVPMVRLL